MGREARAREEKPAELHEIERRLAEARAISLRDRYGRPLIVGAGCHYHGEGTNGPVAWQIATITPTLDPTLPPGTYIMDLQATLRMQVQSGVRVQGVTIVHMPSVSAPQDLNKPPEEAPAGKRVVVKFDEQFDEQETRARAAEAALQEERTAERGSHETETANTAGSGPTSPLAYDAPDPRD